MSARASVERWAEMQGWNDESKIDLLCRYVGALDKVITLDGLVRDPVEHLDFWLENQSKWENDPNPVDVYPYVNGGLTDDDVQDVLAGDDVYSGDEDYYGDGANGCTVKVSEGRGGWWLTVVVDCEHFCECLVTDDGPYSSREAASDGGKDAAIEWCMTNDVNWETDDAEADR